jgi:(1->4)-alpha-D-glucan 1-alpha-D-glucosylmutase
MFYQALVGAWPFGWDGEQNRAEFVARLQAFMQKAAHEAKEETSWLSPDPIYDEGVARFVEAVLEDSALRGKFGDFCSRLGTYGATNGIAKVLLRLCSPGVPDTYQGAELWNQSLVAPDTHKPVDYQKRRAMLDEIASTSDRPALIARLLSAWPDGALKLFVTNIALETRAQLRDVFLQGDYAALPAGEHAIAFIRTTARDSVIVCVPRFSRRLTRGEHAWPIGNAWGEQTILVPAGRFQDAFTAREINTHGLLRLADCFSTFPLALLVATKAPVPEPGLIGAARRVTQ